MAERKTVMQHTSDFFKQLMQIFAALSVISGIFMLVIWQGLESHTQEFVQELAGTKDIVVAVEEVGIEQREQRVLIEEVAAKVDYANERIDKLEPVPIIAEYDDLRSAVNGPCFPGELCTYTYLIRRTSYGAACAAPKLEYVVVDHAGIQHFPQSENAPPRKLNTDWTLISGSFVLPRGVSTGLAEFYMSATYTKCGPNRDVSMQEFSLPLVFQIKGSAP